MYFADIIELLIYKKSLKPSNSGEWVLALGDLSMVLPLDRTVESLMGTVNLALVRKSWAQSHGLAVNTTAERLGGDPNSRCSDIRCHPTYLIACLCSLDLQAVLGCTKAKAQ